MWSYQCDPLGIGERGTVYLEIGHDDGDALGIGGHRRVGIGDIAVNLEADPRTTEAGQLVAVATHIEDFLDIGGIQRGHSQISKRPF